MWPFFYNRINLFLYTHKMKEFLEKLKKNTILFFKAIGLLVGILIVVFIITAILSSNTDKAPVPTNTPTQTTTQKQEKVDPVQERINRINELYADEPSFDRVQKMDGLNSIAIIFKETPDLWITDSIDSITRWQAMNLSNEVNGVASVKTYVGNDAQMYCIATKWQVTECNDYR